MTKYRYLRPMLWTKDLDETLKFYTDILGFNLDEQNDDWGWASLSKDDVAIMIAKPNEHALHSKIFFFFFRAHFTLMLKTWKSFGKI